MKHNLYLLNEVAKLLQKKPHQIVYSISAGHVEDVSFRMGGKRIFQPDDIERLAEHFGVPLEEITEKGGACRNF